MRTYIAHGDMGTLATGRARECFGAIVAWAESDEADAIFHQDDLVAIIDTFSSEKNLSIAIDSGRFTFDGFTVELIK